jgi:hypothetical protein
MRLTGKIRTLRGTVEFPARASSSAPANSAKRLLILDDGRINIGYKIVDFHIWNSKMSSDAVNDCFASQAHLALSLEPTASDLPKASDNREIAWAAYQTTAGGGVSSYNLTDPDHIVVRDLQIVFPQIKNTANVDTVNYYIQMEEYDITDTEAIISIIKEESQDVFN